MWLDLPHNYIRLSSLEVSNQRRFDDWKIKAREIQFLNKNYFLSSGEGGGENKFWWIFMKSLLFSLLPPLTSCALSLLSVKPVIKALRIFFKEMLSSNGPKFHSCCIQGKVSQYNRNEWSCLPWKTMKRWHLGDAIIHTHLLIDSVLTGSLILLQKIARMKRAVMGGAR